MCELISGNELPKRFKNAIGEGRTIDIAVPYWGEGGLETLGLRRGLDVRIVCNIEQPGCNPDVIAQAQELGFEVRKNPRLHAKIYLVGDTAIVGSSNVSSNGLMVEGADAAGMIEWNVLSTKPDFIRSAKKVFAEIWNDQEIVTSDDLKEAQANRRRLASALFKAGAGTTLFSSVRSNPQAFDSVYVLAYDEDLSTASQQLVDAEQNKAGDGGENIEGWQFEGIKENDWLIDIDCRGKRPKWGGVWQAYSQYKVKGERIKVTLGARRQAVKMGGSLLSVSADEKRLFRQGADKLLKESGDKAVSLTRALDIIGQSKT